MGETLKETMQRVKESADLRAWCESNLTPSGKTFICPFCGSGTGPNHTPAFTIHGVRFKCFACDEGGDIFDLAAKVHGIDDTEAAGKAEVTDLVAQWACVTGTDSGPRRKTTPAKPTGIQNQTKPAPATKPKKDPQVDYTDGRNRATAYTRMCADRLTTKDLDADGNVVSVRWAAGAEDAGAYLEGRGFDAALASSFGFGYDPQYCGNVGERRVIVPWPNASWYYTARDLNSSAEKDKYKKPSSKVVGPQPPVTADDLRGNNVLVVEGLMDFWAVRAAGSHASWDWTVVPLGGTGNGEKVARAIADQRPGALVTLMLDDDDHGKTCAEKMATILKDAGVDYVRWPWESVYPGLNDPADMWAAAPSSMRDYLVSWLNGGAKEAHDKAVMEEAEAVMTDRLTSPADVLESIFSMTGAAYPVPTGIDELDDILGGGLQPSSLHVIAASSSSGKTTLSLQLADFIAQSGHPVLLVSCEQRPDELISKSLARISSRLNGATKLPIEATEIRSRLARERWDAERYGKLVAAGNFYAEHIAPNMRYLHTAEKPSVAQIGNLADVMRTVTGQAPVVFIDYLQLISAPEGAKDMRLAVDDNMTALRALASRLKTPVWVVSSVGRSAYYGTVDMSSFKESSGIEFSAYVALGLQPFGMADDVAKGKSEAAMKAAGKAAETTMREQVVRQVELTVLKNRYGRTRPKHGIPLIYRANVDRFDRMEVDR